MYLSMSQYLFSPTKSKGPVRACPYLKQTMDVSLDKTHISTQKLSPPLTTEPESEPATASVKNGASDIETRRSHGQPGTAVIREPSPPKVLRWSYDAQVEDQKEIHRKGTFSPLADSLRPEHLIKLPPGLEYPGALPATEKPIDKVNTASSGSLRDDMESLKMHDPACVLVVKKIKKLGFESPQCLRNHFSQYGVVLDVMVALTHSPQKSKSARVRPAAMGFVVMSDAGGVQSALQAGISQDVSGFGIELRSFSSFNDYYGAAE